MNRTPAALFVFAVLFPIGAAGDSPKLSAKHVAPTADRKSAEELARELIEVQGMLRLLPQIRAQTLADFRERYPDLPEEFWKTFEDRMNADDMINLAIPVYVKHFTEQEMRAALAFHYSPEGQSILAKTPQLLNDLAVVGTDWATGIGSEAERRVQEISLPVQLPCEMSSPPGELAQKVQRFHGEGYLEPEALERVQPEYKPELRVAGITGTVILEAIVAADGRVHDLRVLRSPHPSLSRAACDALYQWRFRPASLHGTGVPALLILTMKFEQPQASEQ